MNLLDVCELSVRYGDNMAVEKLSFSINAKESVGLVGESGSGKTQTALALLGLSPESAKVSGNIRFDGRELIGASEADLNELRGVRLAMVFQDPQAALNPYMRIGDQLRRILIAHGLAGDDPDAHVTGMLKKVGLPDPGRQSRAYPHQLSGGMQQRAMIASALIASPDLLIADEPTTALDVTVQAQILELLRTIRHNTALLLITHDLGIVAGHCERMLVLNKGRLVESGPTKALFAEPQDAHTAALLDAVTGLQERAPRPATDELMLSVDGASLSYREPGHGRLHALKSVDLTLNKGETVAIVGESGSGKSSLARAILGLTDVDSGTLRFLGAALPAGAGRRSIETRRKLQLVFQDPLASLNPQMRVDDIVSEPLTVHAPALDAAAVSERVSETLSQVGLGREFLDRYPHELSGGQAQRVAIARALIVEPAILVCDEALAALDGTVRVQILSLLAEIQTRTELSILFISHDLSVVSSISDRVMVMYLGRVVEAADTRSIFTSPRHPYTRALLDAVPVPDPAIVNIARPLRGEVPSILSPPPGCPFHPRCEYAETICRTELPEATAIGTTTVRCHRAAEIDLQV